MLKEQLRVLFILCLIGEFILACIHFNIISSSIPSMGAPIYIGSLILTSTDFIVAVMSAVMVACPAIICAIVVEYQLVKRSLGNMAALFKDHPLTLVVLVLAVILYFIGIALEFEFAASRIRESTKGPQLGGKSKDIPEEAVMMMTFIFVLGTTLLGVITATLWHRHKIQPV